MHLPYPVTLFDSVIGTEEVWGLCPSFAGTSGASGCMSAQVASVPLIGIGAAPFAGKHSSRREPAEHSVSAADQWQVRANDCSKPLQCFCYLPRVNAMSAFCTLLVAAGDIRQFFFGGVCSDFHYRTTASVRSEVDPCTPIRTSVEAANIRQFSFGGVSSNLQ